jgi:Zn-dependent protease with chaperone function
MAMLKNHNPFGAVERLSRLFSAHPHTEERVQRLMAMAQSRHGRSLPAQGYRMLGWL